ncbi:MAG: hypothetical protein ACPMAQ_18915, partial [Phycisphaerae bacterium]
LNPKGRPRVMLAGHIDQIGLMVRYISDGGVRRPCWASSRRPRGVRDGCDGLNRHGGKAPCRRVL